MLVMIGFSTDKMVLMITSWMRSKVPSKSAPILSYSCRSYLNESFDSGAAFVSDPVYSVEAALFF